MLREHPVSHLRRSRSSGAGQSFRLPRVATSRWAGAGAASNRGAATLVRLGPVEPPESAPRRPVRGPAGAATAGAGGAPTGAKCRGERRHSARYRRPPPTARRHRRAARHRRSPRSLRRRLVRALERVGRLEHAADADGGVGGRLRRTARFRPVHSPRPDRSRLPSRRRPPNCPRPGAALAVAGVGACSASASPAAVSSARPRPVPQVARPTDRDRSPRLADLRKNAAPGVSSDGTMEPGEPSTTRKASEL